MRHKCERSPIVMAALNTVGVKGVSFRTVRQGSPVYCSRSTVERIITIDQMGMGQARGILE